MRTECAAGARCSECWRRELTSSWRSFSQPVALLAPPGPSAHVRAGFHRLRETDGCKGPTRSYRVGDLLPKAPMPLLRTCMTNEDDAGAKVAAASFEMDAPCGVPEVVAIELELQRGRAFPATGRAAKATRPSTTTRAPKIDAFAEPRSLGIGRAMPCLQPVALLARPVPSAQIRDQVSSPLKGTLGPSGVRVSLVEGSPLWPTSCAGRE